MIPQKSAPAPFLELNTIQTDRFKTETVSITVCLPLDRELTPLYGLVLSVLKRGTERYPTQGHINRRLDELYAAGISLRLDRIGNNCILGFSAEMLDGEYTDGQTDIFDGVLDVITQMLFHPLTDETGCFLGQFVESEKDVTCDLIQSAINNPKSYASIRCREIMFEDDDYGASLSGTVEQIRAVTPESLTRVYKELIQNREFHVFYIGSRQKEQVSERILRCLRPYLSSAVPFVPNKGIGCKTFEACKRIDEKSEIAQGKLVIGMRTGIHILHKDFYAMLVLAELYGGSPISKLFMNVRERLSLCYYCSAVYEIYKGTIFVSCGVDPDKREEAEAEIFRQLADIREGKIKASEFDAAIKSLVNSYRSISDLPSTLEAYYMGRDIFGVSCTVGECIAAIQAVSIDDVIRVAKDITTDTVYFLWGDLKEDEEDEDETFDCL